MKTLCIASCGKSKIWDKQPQAGPMPARSVYVGPFSGACGRYADKFFPESWCILSAKYGFVLPDDLIPASSMSVLMTAVPSRFRRMICADRRKRRAC